MHTKVVFAARLLMGDCLDSLDLLLNLWRDRAVPSKAGVQSIFCRIRRK